VRRNVAGHQRHPQQQQGDAGVTFTKLNRTLFAPMARERVRGITRANPGLFARLRAPYLTSCSSVPMANPSLAAREPT
jgi:hypothetical protein